MVKKERWMLPVKEWYKRKMLLWRFFVPMYDANNPSTGLKQQQDGKLGEERRGEGKGREANAGEEKRGEGEVKGGGSRGGEGRREGIGGDGGWRMERKDEGWEARTEGLNKI
jgi:hypothetical protein